MTEELKQNSAIFSKTWYEDNTTSYAANHEITSNQTCDVAIIGGGLAGLCLLQNLIKEGVDALLLEANEIGKKEEMFLEWQSLDFLTILRTPHIFLDV